jgi:hypothetical protein
VVLPVLQVTRFQELVNQVQKSLVGDALTQYLQQGFVIQVVEETFDVALDPPSNASGLLDASQCRMATSAWSEAMRGF